MHRVALAIVYLATTAAVAFAFNANSGDEMLALAIWATASVLLGAGTGRLSFALLAFASIPIAVPFGAPDNYQFSEPVPIWWSAAICCWLSAILIFVAAIGRQIVDARWRPARS